MRIIGYILAICLVSACSSMSLQDCQSTDWNELGRHDGANGKTSSRFTHYLNSCAKHNVAPNEGAYFKGRKEGLKQYCTPSNAYLVGSQGESYDGVCPTEVESRFLSDHQKGYAIYLLKSELDSARSRIQSLESEIANLKKED